jgi:CheY-like chemotaxis protein
MYAEYVKVLARYAEDIFRDMTGVDVLEHKVLPEERLSPGSPYAYVISYQHVEKGVTGQIVLGFANDAMALSVASSLGETMGLPRLEEMDDTAADLLGEFMNTIVGRTISEWDRMGMPVRFSPPTATRFAKVQREPTPGDEQTWAIILNLHQGHIVFRVTFQEGLAGGEEDSGRRRILVAEDSTVVRNFVVSTLEKNGFMVRHAENGRLATEMYDEFRPHLVLMDLVMPEMGGLDAMSAIREQHPEARFIVLTSSSRRDEVQAARDIGVDAYLIKPFKPDVLLAEVTTVFAGMGWSAA